jgi:RNA polymerase sigma-70 factor (ECF subfamily)
MVDDLRREIEQLLHQARAGDDQAREKLFARCRNYLAVAARAQLESRLRAKVDASDLVQQTMLEAHRDFDKFDGRSEREWIGWLKKILSHNAADFLRHYRKTAKRQVDRERPIKNIGDSSSIRGVPEPADAVGTPSELFAKNDQQLRLADALTHLPDDYQEVIQLRNLQHLSFQEVAERMGRSRPAVQMLWARAIEKLQSLLENA